MICGGPDRRPLIDRWTPMKPVKEVDSKRVVVRRRRFFQEFKRRAVEQTLAPGASAAGIALKYRLNANVLFKWRRQYLREFATAKAKPAALLPVRIEGSNAALPAGTPERIPADKSARSLELPRCIEIEVFGALIRIKGAVDPDALDSVLEALSQR